MGNKYFTNLIYNSSNKNISDLVSDIWKYIENERMTKNDIDILKEMLDSKIIFSNDVYCIIAYKPFNILVYNPINTDYTEFPKNCIYMPLFENNFILIVKNMILNEILGIVESANYDPESYRKIYNIVFENEML